MAAIGEHEYTHSLLELGERSGELIVNELSVVKTPRLVERIVLIAVDVRYLTAMT